MRSLRLTLAAALLVVLVPGARTARADSYDMPTRLRFSLVHDAIPRYYEMLGIVGTRDEALAGQLLLPGVDLPEALSAERLREGILWAQPLPWALEGSEEAGRKPGTYSLSNNWTAQLSYHHSVLSRTLSNEELRNKKLTDFSTAGDRDVLGLQMDWRLAGSTIGLGYRFQSARGEPGSGIAGIGDRFMHAFTLGFTKEWGGAKPTEP